EPLNDFFEEEDLMDKFPEELIDLVSVDGDIYSVPVDIHRGNPVFYNKEIFEENDIEVPTTFDEFFEVADELEEAGVTPLALGDKESCGATMIFGYILLSAIRPYDYLQLLD